MSNSKTNPDVSHIPQDAARRRLALGLGLLPMLPLLPGCGGANNSDFINTRDEIDDALVDTGGPDSPEAATPSAAPSGSQAKHPGLLHTETDLKRIRDKLAAKEKPWVDGWDALLSSGRAHLGASPRPLETVFRGTDGDNFGQMYTDMQRAHQLALRWKITGDEDYAKKALLFLNAWSSKLA